MQDDATQ